MKFKSQLLSTTAAFAVALTSESVIAQDADEDMFSLEEIIVTARKKEENLQDAPVSISAFTAASLERNNLVDVAEIAKLTAGFSLDGEFGRDDDRPVIRGQANILGSSGVSYFIDGVYITGSLLDYDLDQVERIEVIKGPQSALYGRNTYSGAINIITKSPSIDTEGSFKAGYGSHNEFELSASLRGPISDVVSGSLSARFYDRDGAFTNTVDGRKVGGAQTKSISGSIYVRPTEELDIRARVHFMDSNDDHQAIANTDANDNNCYFDTGYSYLGGGRYFCGEVMSPEIHLDDVRALGFEGFRKRQKLQTSLAINYDISDEMTLTSLTAYNTEDGVDAFDGDYQSLSYAPSNVVMLPGFFFGINGAGVYFSGSEAANFSSHDGWKTDDFSQEFRLSYTSDKFEVLGGVYYLKSKSDGEGLQQFPDGFSAAVREAWAERKGDFDAACAADPSCFFTLDFGFFGPPAFTLPLNNYLSERTLTNKAIFGRVAFNATEQLELAVEARYANDKVERTRWSNPISYDEAGNGTPGTSSTTMSPVVDINSFTPRFTVGYEVDDNINVFAVVANGTKPGGSNGATAAAAGFPTYDEEEAWTYEAGIKAMLMDRQMRFNMSVFRTDISDYQLTQSFLQEDGGVIIGTGTAIDNVGKVKLEGVEFEIQYAPQAVPGLVLDANFAYIDSEITAGSDLNEGKLLDTADDGSVNCSTGFEHPETGSCQSGDNTKYGSLVGKQLPRQAKYSGYVGISYTHQVNDTWDITAGVNYSYESKRYIQVHNLAYTGASNMVSANLSFESDDMAIRFWAKNLLDEDSAIGAFRFIENDGSFRRSFAVSPRVGPTIGANVSYRF